MPKHFTRASVFSVPSIISCCQHNKTMRTNRNLGYLKIPNMLRDSITMLLKIYKLQINYRQS